MPATLVPTLSPTPRSFVTIPLTTPTAFSKDSPHSSWTNPCSEVDDDVENWEMYKPGGLHPVVLGDVFHDRYTVVHKLGQGGFATAWLVWDRIHNQYVALKIMRADHSENCQELKILQYLSKLDIDLAENFICPFLDQFWL
ncbi:hypothetical protein B0J14DRAFT_197517 [Halenospora varia]|nr:hypothetical protein B0J14DRAFT_197517 [Halenospora varia]